MSKRTLTTLLSAIAVSAATALSVPTATLIAAPSSEAGKSSSAKAVVQQDLHRASGGIAGDRLQGRHQGLRRRPSRPRARRSTRLRRRSSNYMSYLTGRHDAVLAAAGGGKKVYSYGYVFNGFAAELTEAQADKIRSMSGVLSVEKDEIVRGRHFVDADLPRPRRAGRSLGPARRRGAAPARTSSSASSTRGVWPESLSFSDRTGANGNATKDGKLAYQQIPGWHGKCTPGEAFNASLCNQKLIGAQHFNAGWGGDAGINAQRPVGVHVGPRLQRSRHAHLVDRGRQPRTSP